MSRIEQGGPGPDPAETRARPPERRAPLAGLGALVADAYRALWGYDRALARAEAAADASDAVAAEVTREIERVRMRGPGPVASYADARIRASERAAAASERAAAAATRSSQALAHLLGLISDAADAQRAHVEAGRQAEAAMASADPEGPEDATDPAPEAEAAGGHPVRTGPPAHPGELTERERALVAAYVRELLRRNEDSVLSRAFPPRPVDDPADVPVFAGDVATPAPGEDRDRVIAALCQTLEGRRWEVATAGLVGTPADAPAQPEVGVDPGAPEGDRPVFLVPEYLEGGMTARLRRDQDERFWAMAVAGSGAPAREAVPAAPRDRRLSPRFQFERPSPIRGLAAAAVIADDLQASTGPGDPAPPPELPEAPAHDTAAVRARERAVRLRRLVGAGAAGAAAGELLHLERHDPEDARRIRALAPDLAAVRARVPEAAVTVTVAVALDAEAVVDPDARLIVLEVPYVSASRARSTRYAVHYEGRPIAEVDPSVTMTAVMRSDSPVTRITVSLPRPWSAWVRGASAVPGPADPGGDNKPAASSRTRPRRRIRSRSEGGG